MISTKSLFKLVFTLLLLAGLSLMGQVPVLLHDQQEHYPIGTQVEHFCDKDDTLTIASMQGQEVASRFIKMSSNQITEDYEHSNWFRITIKNTNHTAHDQWMLESWGFDMDEIEFYSTSKDGFKKISLGYTVPFANRTIATKNPVFPIEVKAGEEKVYFLKVHRHSPFHLSLVIRTNEVFIRHMANEYWYLGIFYGIFIFLGTVALLMFISLRQRIYLFYGFCVATEILYCMRRDGLGFQFLWPDYPTLNLILEFNLPQLMFIVAAIWFSMQFLNLKKELPFFYYLSIVGIALRTLIFIIIQFTTFRDTNIFVLDFVFLLIPYLSGIFSKRNGHPYAGYYVVAYSCLFISFVLIILEDNQLLPLLPYNWYWINIGMLLEVLFLALALARHIRYLQEQKELAQEQVIENLNYRNELQGKMNMELEQKVKARTEEISEMLIQREHQNEALKKANEELESLNQKVHEMNELLNQDNKQLRLDVTELGQSRVLLKDVSFEEFTKFFPDDASCLKYLADLKWQKEFRCKKCGYNKGNHDGNRFGIRCKNCNYLESPTAGTLFHKLKFPLTKAFYLMYLIYLKGKSMSLDELSQILDLRRETCWSFRKKILEAQVEYSKKGIIQSEQGWASIVMEAHVAE